MTAGIGEIWKAILTRWEYTEKQPNKANVFIRFRKTNIYKVPRKSKGV